MAVKILEYFKQDISVLQLVPSDGGRFEVSADDDLVFSKLESDRFPEYDEIKQALKNR